MLEEKVREVFADMVVLKDPQRSQYFSNLSIPSYMRDWLVMKFSDDDGSIDYDSVRRYIKRYIPNRDDFEQYKFQMVNGETVQFLARVRVSVDVKRGKTMFELPDFGGSRGGAAGVVAFDVAEEWQSTLLHESENWGIVSLSWTMEGTPSKPKGVITMVGYKPFCPYSIDLDFIEKRGENLQRRNGLMSSLVLLTIILMATVTKMVKSAKKRSCSFCAGFCLLWKSDSI